MRLRAGIGDDGVSMCRKWCGACDKVRGRLGQRNGQQGETDDAAKGFTRLAGEVSESSRAKKGRSERKRKKAKDEKLDGREGKREVMKFSGGQGPLARFGWASEKLKR